MTENQSTKEYLELLKEYCSNCERNQKFGEAESTKRRIAQLKKQEERAMIQALEAQQESERSEIEDTHILEFQEFLKAWDERIKAQGQHTQEQIDNLTALQQEEQQQLADKLDKELPLKPKPSSELLNLMKIQQALAKQKAYGEAKAVKKKIRQIESNELKMWNAEKNKKIAWQQAHLEKRQEGRMNALKIKLKAAEGELEKAKVLEIEQRLQKYHNIKKGLQNYQITQQNLLSATGTLGPI